MEAFETARLTATRLAAEDLDDLVRLHLDPEVSRFLGGIRSPESTAVYLDTNLRHWTDHGFGLWTLRTPDGGFVGRAGLRYIDLEGIQELEIAYTLDKPAWGRGLASEVAGTLVEIWKTRLAASSLVGVADLDNTTSQGVLRKVGFAYERDAVFDDAAVAVFRQDR
ncbi:GNAT family N-acetyltransferase [Caulobacter sp. ErkDOM-YI]|uniref:GNAT family N-acetyltransferase n=1 Tax=unclassified Caulobacter TaxID=2648921 RepID=UPI003AF6C551